jgi:transposase
MQDLELYRKILGIQSPWLLTDVKLDLQKRSVTLSVEYDKKMPMVCPICLGAADTYDHKKRSWRHLDTCQLMTIIECEIPRANCSDHGVKQLEVPWAEPNSRFTALFEALVINWLKAGSIKAVAGLLGLSWEQVAGIQSRAVKRGLSRREVTPIKHLGLDETSFQKHHEYVTVLLDQSTGIVLDVLDDRKAETLKAWLESKPIHHLRKIETVSMDMWDPFILAIKACVPEAEAKICFDRYHVAGHFAQALDKVRNQEHRLLLEEQGFSPLTGTKYDWLINAGKTDNRSRREFMQLTKACLKTARAWAIKEAAAKLWHYVYRLAAEKAWAHLLNWIAHCRLKPVIKVGKMVKHYLWGIINAIVAKVTNAASEAKNSRIQWLKKMACGFRNRSRFRAAILFHFGGLDLLPETAKALI